MILLKRKTLKISAISIVLLSAVALSVTFYTFYKGICEIANLMFSDETTEIKEGFTPELLDTLEKQYGITVPENSVFLKGYNANAFQDYSHVVVVFECPLHNFDNESMSLSDCMSIDYISQLLSLNEKDYVSAIEKERHENLLGDRYGRLGHCVKNTKKGDTTVSYMLSDGKMLVKIVGDYPNRRFK